MREIIGEHVETGETITEDEYEPPEVKVQIYRNLDSYHSRYGVPESQGKDVAIIDVKNVLGETAYHIVDDLQTVDIYDAEDSQGVDRDQPYDSPTQGEVQGNTIASGDFDLFYESSSTVARNPVLVITNTKTISGIEIGADGNLVTGADDGGRHLFHDNYNMSEDNTSGSDYNNQRSDGCFIPSTIEMVKMLDFLEAYVPKDTYIPGNLREISPY